MFAFSDLFLEGLGDLFLRNAASARTYVYA